MKSSLIIFALLIAFISEGQADVTLTGTFKREIEVASRIPDSPTYKDTVIPEPDINYPLLSLRYETTSEIASIEPATVKLKENLPTLYHTYVKLGIGTELMPLGEVYFDATRSRKFVYGAHLKHLSSFGNIPDYERSTFDRTGVELFGGINERKYKLNGNFHYRNQGLHYYGIKAPLDSLGRDYTAQRYNDLGFGARFESDTRIDTFDIDYKVGVNYNYFNTKRPVFDSISDWRSREHFFGLNGNGEYKLGKEIYNLDASLRYNEYTYGVEGDSISALDTFIYRQNAIVSLKPTISTYLWNYKFKAKVGVDVTFDGDGKTYAHIYPIAEIKYTMFDGIFIPYAGLRGGLQQTTLKSLTMENEFLRPNVQMRNEDKAFEIYGGFKGTLSRRISFNVGGGYARVRNKALFVNDTTYSLGNKFDVIFDTMNQVTIEGSLSYQMMEKLKIDLIGTYNSYELLNNSYAWNLPQVKFVARAHYNLFDKLLVNLDANFEGGRRALVFADGEGISQENGQFYKKLNTIYDINLGAEYRYTPRLSVFLQANNIASQRYMRWYNAPVHSFQVLGGLTFRF